MKYEPDKDKMIFKAIEAYYGSECPEKAPDCPCCKAWNEYWEMIGRSRELGWEEMDIV